MNIGIVDIDTSHPRAWIPILRGFGYEVTSMWDGGSVHSNSYAMQFAAEHGLRIVESLADLADQVDAAIVHSCNWDLHLERARPFVEAEKPLLIDKPLAGCMHDLRQLIEWSDSGARWTGGSSLRCTEEVRSFMQTPASERGEVRSAMAGCGTDDFNYGIHAYSLLWSIMGPGAAAVRWLGDEPQRCVEISWPEGRRGIVTCGGKQGSLPSFATIVTTKNVFHITPKTTAEPLYKNLLLRDLPYLNGETGTPPVDHRELIEPERAAVAALESQRRSGEWIGLNDVPDDIGYDGGAFAIEYRAVRGK